MLKGIDVSAWNGDISSALTGCSFVAIRASVGMYTDPSYDAHFAQARHYGIDINIAYHYLLPPGPGPARQALTLLRKAANADAFALDMESTALKYPATAKSFIINLRKNDPRHRKILLYSSEGTWPGNMGQDLNWVANWSREPHIRYAIWQIGVRGVDWDTAPDNLKQLLGMA